MLDDGYPKLRDATVPVKLADCAFAASVNGDVPQDPAALVRAERLTKPAVLPEMELLVKKIGLATGVTFGKDVVRGLDGFPLPVGVNAMALFNDVIEIESDNARDSARPETAGRSCIRTTYIRSGYSSPRTTTDYRLRTPSDTL